jgi:hypothetical protein
LGAYRIPQFLGIEVFVVFLPCSHKLGTQEKNIGKLKKMCPILASHVISYENLDIYVGLCCSLANITTLSLWMESVGILDPWFLQEDDVEAHAFFVTDVRFI